MSDQTNRQELYEESVRLGKLIFIGFAVTHMLNDERSPHQMMYNSVDSFKKYLETKAPKTIQVINNHLHEFAEVSDVFDLNVEPTETQDPKEIDGIWHFSPSRILGTSAHHAGILFLEQMLINNFWQPIPSTGMRYFPPSFDNQIVEAKIHWERMRLFKSTDIVFKYIEILDETEELPNLKPQAPKKTTAHKSVSEITEDYHDSEGLLPEPLTGSKTELIFAVIGSRVTRDISDTFNSMILNRSIYAIEISERKYELYFTKQYHPRLTEFKERLEEYRSSTRNN